MMHQEVKVLFQGEEQIMRFNEIQQSVDDDKYGKWDFDDTRRPRFTLKQINKIRTMEELAKAEHQGKISQYKQMYSRSE